MGTTPSTPLTASLYEACAAGNVEDIKLFLNNDKELLNKHFNGVTPLFIATKNAHVEAVSVLIEAGADPNVECSDSDFFFTPLYLACDRGFLDIVNILLEKGKAIVNYQRPTYGSGPIHIACYRGNLEVVKVLILKGKADVNVGRLTDGATPVFLASSRGFSEIVDFLLEFGHADANKCLSLQTTNPLQIACRKNHLAVVNSLLVKGHVSESLHHGDSEDVPLQIACLEGNIGLIQILLNVGHADINFPPTYSPLFLACKGGKTEVVELLLHWNAKVNVVCGQCTPLHISCEEGHANIVQLLIDIGKADVNIPDLQHRTPLFTASLQNDERIVKILMNANADITLADRSGNTPLTLFVSPEIRTLLLSGIITFLCGHHPRCGANSILQQLPQWIVAEIAQLFLPKRPMAEDNETICYKMLARRYRNKL